MIEKESVPYHSCAREIVTLIAAVWRRPVPYCLHAVCCAAVSRHANEDGGGNRLAANLRAVGRAARAVSESICRARFRRRETLSGYAG